MRRKSLNGDRKSVATDRAESPAKRNENELHGDSMTAGRNYVYSLKVVEPLEIPAVLLSVVLLHALRGGHTVDSAHRPAGRARRSEPYCRSEPRRSAARDGHTAADVRFMQGMIGHHAQAVEMTELLSTRTSSDAMRKLAQRIQVSQTDEIKMMERWLSARGEEVPVRARAPHDGGAC